MGDDSDALLEGGALQTPVGVGVFRSDMFPGRHFAATCNSGPHENISEGSTLKIYNKGWITKKFFS